MLVQWFANVGDDSAVSWVEITNNYLIHFTGAGSVPNNATPVVRPRNAYVWPEELWIGPAVMSGSQQVLSWRKPSASGQQGKVFKIVFAESLASAPFITAYDNEDLDTWDIEMLTGTDSTNWTSLLKLFCTGSESSNTPPATAWAVKETGGAGSRNPNGLQGSSAIVTVPFIPGAGDDFTFTMAPAVPADANYGNEGKYDPKLTVTFVHV